MTIITDSNLQLRIAEIKEDWRTQHHYVHEDGSHSFIVTDEDGQHANPRDDDGNVTTLIMEHRDYKPLDEDSAGLSEARDRWDWLGTFGYSSRGQRFPSQPSEVDKALTKYDRSQIMARYIAMFRPDILHYEDEWSVSGYTQGDWANGWGYITRSDWEEAMGEDYTGDLTPEKAFKQELDIYEQYFRGDVYGWVGLSKGDPIVILGEQGAYVDDHEVKEDSVWGHLGYDDPKDIVRQYNESPIVEEH